MVMFCYGFGMIQPVFNISDSKNFRTDEHLKKTKANLFRRARILPCCEPRVYWQFLCFCNRRLRLKLTTGCRYDFRSQIRKQYNSTNCAFCKDLHQNDIRLAKIRTDTPFSLFRIDALLIKNAIFTIYHGKLSTRISFRSTHTRAK